MKRLGILLMLLMFSLVSCESKRPQGNGSFTVTIEGRSILTNATITVTKEGSGEALAEGTSDGDGLFSLGAVSAVGNLRVKACGGQFFSAGAQEAVSFNGCLEARTTVSDQKKVTVFVDFVSTLAATYGTDTAEEEVRAYLALSADSAALEETTLTDATKRYLWQEAFAIVARDIATANEIGVETSLSTEKLWGLVLDDLADDHIINGSAGAKFGPALLVDEQVLRTLVPAALAQVSATFTASDLADWAHHLAVTPAAFLEGGEESDGDTLPDETGDETLYPDYDTVGNPPAIEIKEPKNNAVLFGTIAIRAQRTLDSCPLVSVNCTMTDSDGAGVVLTDTHPHAEVFEATLDTVARELADGQYTVTCSGSNGIQQANKSVKITLSNHNPVTILTYVTGKVSGIESAEIFDAAGTKVATLTEENGAVQGDLPPGEYTVKVTGGEYESAVFTNANGDPKTLELATPLRSRFVVEAGKTTKVYVTPITTVREIVYLGLKEKGGRTEDEAIDDALELLETHYGEGLQPYGRPQAGEPGEGATQHWLANAAFEQLAADIAAAKGLSSGAVLMDDVLDVLAADLVEASALFDGYDRNEETLKIQGFAVDSYLYRYHYAVALKRFIEEKTSYAYQDFQAMIYHCAMDTSELFPADKKPIEVVAQPPEITALSFKRPEESAFTTYSDPNAIPFVRDALDLRFGVSLGKTATLETLEILLDGTTPLADLGDLVKEGALYRADSLVISGSDGERSLTLKAADDQNNRGQRVIRVIKDTVPPGVTVTPPAAEVIKGDITFSFTASDEYLAKEYYTVTPQGGSPTTYPYEPVSDSGTITLSEITEDGTYSVTFTAEDKAGNKGSQSFTRTRDTTPPVAMITVETLEETPRQMPTANKWVNVNDFEVLFSGVSDRPGSMLTYRYTVSRGGVVEQASYQTTGSSWESVQYLSDLGETDKSNLLQTKNTVTAWVVDEVGNESAKQTFDIYVDTVPPVLTVGDVPTVPVNAFTFTYTATDTNMKRVWITDEVGTDITITEGASGTRNYSLDCSTGAKEGIHVVTFRAEDEADNKAPEVEKTLRIDCTAPVFLSDPFAGTPIEQDGVFVNLSDLTLSVSLSEAATVHYDLLKDNVPTSCTGDISYGGSGVLPVSCPFVVGGANDGTYTFVLSATDVAGNKSVELRRTFTLDTVAPVFSYTTLSKTLPWNPFRETGDTLVTFEAQDANFTYCTYRMNETNVLEISPDSIKKNGAGEDTGKLELTLKNLSGAYFRNDEDNEITAECHDRAGNVATEAFRWFHDVTIPKVALVSTSPAIPSHGVLTTTPLTVNLKVTDNSQEKFSSPQGLVPRVYCQWKNSATTDWQYCADGSSAGKEPTYNPQDKYFAVSFSFSGGTVNRVYSLRFFAQDAAKNREESETVDQNYFLTYRFDNVAPIPRILFGTPEQTTSTTASYVLIFDTPISDVSGVKAYAKSATWSTTVSCSQGYLQITGVNCVPGPFGMPLCTLITEQRDDGYTCSFENLPTAFDGTVFFKAKDIYGNGDYDFSSTAACAYDGTNPCLKRPLKVDATLPEVSVTVDENSRYVNGTQSITAYVNVTSSSNIVSQKCSIAKLQPPVSYVDVTTPFDCQSGVVVIPLSAVSGLSDGTYYVRVVAQNAVGSSAGTSQFVLDRVAPVVDVFSVKISRQYYKSGETVPLSLEVSDVRSGIKSFLVTLAAGRFRRPDGSIVSSSVSSPLLSRTYPEGSNSVSATESDVVQSVSDISGEYYQLRISVTDRAGNTYTEYRNLSPSLRILSCVGGTCPETKMTLGSGQEAGGVFGVNLERLPLDTYDEVVKKAEIWVNGHRIGLGDYWYDSAEGYSPFCLNGNEFENYAYPYSGEGGSSFLKALPIKKMSDIQIAVPVPRFRNAYGENYPSFCGSDCVFKYLFLPEGAQIKVTDNFGVEKTLALSDKKTFSQTECGMPYGYRRCSCVTSGYPPNQTVVCELQEYDSVSNAGKILQTGLSQSACYSRLDF